MKPIIQTLSTGALLLLLITGFATEVLGKATLPQWTYNADMIFPADQSLNRPEDGIALLDGRLIVTDQACGLRLVERNGSSRPFGKMAAAGYIHNPPEIEGCANGVSIEPSGTHVLVADVFRGGIYRIEIATEETEKIYQHAYGVNAVRADSRGGIWFTQSTRNMPEEGAAGLWDSVWIARPDGAVCYLPPGNDAGQRKPLYLADDFIFANGLALDEKNKILYVAETFGNKVWQFCMDIESGSVSHRKVATDVSAPDNVELDNQGRLWISSPLRSEINVYDPATDSTSSVFRISTQKSEELIEKIEARLAEGISWSDLAVPELWEPLSGFITGLILSPDEKTVYLSGLGNSLVKLEMNGIVTNSQTTFMEDGGWCWYQDPRVIINDGKLVVGGLSGQSGDVKVAVHDLVNGVNLGTTILDKDFQRDDHNAPAFYARPDGRILAMWAKHGNEKLHHYSISSADDYLQWGEPEQFVHEYEEEWGVTYMNLYYMEKEGLLYNFFRDGPTFNPAFITSGDHGTSWANRTHFIADEVAGRHRPYPRYVQRDADTVGVSFTEGHPRNFGNSLYYADFRDGTFFMADGTRIKELADGPLLPSEAEKIFSGSGIEAKPDGFESVPNSAWTCAMATDALNHPHVGYTLYLSDSDHRFRIASWNGKEWIDREIAYAGNCLYPRESSYTGLMSFDPVDPTQVFISSDVDPSTGADLGGKHEIYRARIREGDDISSIKWEALTSGSDHRNIRPIVVAGEGYKAVLWLRGPYRTYVDYASDVVGHVLDAESAPVD